MKKIVIKEIDKLRSTLHKNKVITEYLIYYIDNDIKIATFVELGDTDKDNRLGELMEKYFMKNDTEMYHNVDIEIIKFEEIKK